MSELTAVIDQLPVGSAEILNSPHVSEGPGRIARAPVPSIYVDDRGDIHRIRVGRQRLNLLYSKQGVMRSGYLHPHPLHSIVISGEVEVWTLGETGTNKATYQQYDHFTIPPYVPHILYFPNRDDTILAEWWSPINAEFQCYYYHPYRKTIDIQNSIRNKEMEGSNSNNNNNTNNDTIRTGTTTGRHQRLIPQDDVMQYTSSFRNNNNNSSSNNYYYNTLLLPFVRYSGWCISITIATTIGIAIGMALSEDPSNNNNNSNGHEGSSNKK